MALARAVRRRGRRPARGGPGLDAAAGVALRRGDAARAASERPGAAGPERRYGVPDHLHHQRPGRHARPGRGRYRGARGAARGGAGRAGAPAAVVEAARPVARAGPVQRREPRRDAGDLDVAAHGPVDDRRDHAAQPAPERPGDDHRMTRNDRRVAIITGGSQGIGADLVAAYRGRGWAVVANARTIGPSADPDVLTVEGDIAKRATAEEIVEGALEQFGRIDTLVNNAGAFVSKPFTDYTAADYALLTGVNLGGFFWLTQRVIAEMVRRYGGHVVNISATLAEAANSHAPSVLSALTKGGLAAATRSLAVEYASRGIRVNAVSPGTIQTPVYPADSYEGLGDQLPPLGRVGQVRDVVAGVLFLESSPYITGEILHIDGGQTAGH